MNSLANVNTETPRTTEVTQRNAFFRQTLKGLPTAVCANVVEFSNSFRVHSAYLVMSQGVVPGSNLPTPSALLSLSLKRKLRSEADAAIALRGAGAESELADLRQRVRQAELRRAQISDRCSRIVVIEKIRNVHAEN